MPPEKTNQSNMGNPMSAPMPPKSGKSGWLFWVLGLILVLVAAAAVYAMLNTTTWFKGDAKSNDTEDMQMMDDGTVMAGDQMEGDMVGGDANVSGDVNIPPPPPGLPGGPTN